MRMKQHTAKSLAKYLGNGVSFILENTLREKRGSIFGITSESVCVSYGSHSRMHFGGEIAKLRPVLKSYKILIKPMEFEGALLGLAIPSGQGDPEYAVGEMAEYIDQLINLGFGAIPDTESPTGYVDLFGYPCCLGDEE